MLQLTASRASRQSGHPSTVERQPCRLQGLQRLTGGTALGFCRSFRDMVQGLSLLKLGDGQQAQHTQLSMVQESPSGLSGGSSSAGSDKSSQGLAKSHSIKRSPLGRSVVTALEAELDQVGSCLFRQLCIQSAACRALTGAPPTQGGRQCFRAAGYMGSNWLPTLDLLHLNMYLDTRC